MTREEMLKWLKEMAGLDYPYKPMLKALEMAIKALSQEPCEDAISRDAAIRTCMGMRRDTGIYEAPYDYAEDVLSQLPSVTQKSGKMLLTPMSNIAYCSECDYLFKDIPASTVEHFKFCPNCGAKMVEPQESGDRK